MRRAVVVAACVALVGSWSVGSFAQDPPSPPDETPPVETGKPDEVPPPDAGKPDDAPPSDSGKPDDVPKGKAKGKNNVTSRHLLLPPDGMEDSMAAGNFWLKQNPARSAIRVQVSGLEPSETYDVVLALGEESETIGSITTYPPAPPEDSAYVRVAHLSPDAPNVDVWVDGAMVLADVPYLAVSGYLPVPPGDHDVLVTETGTTEPAVIEATVTLDPMTSYTVAATGLVAEIAPLVLVDDREVDPPAAKVRFVHTSPDAPAVDVAVKDGDVLFGDVEFREASEYLTLPPMTVDVEVRLAGTDTVALEIPGVELEAGVNVTVFAVGLVADETLGALPVIDASLEDADDMGEPGSGQLRVDTKRGDMLPFGAESVAELVGAIVTVVDPDGNVVLTTEVSDLGIHNPGRDGIHRPSGDAGDDGEGDEGDAGGGGGFEAVTESEREFLVVGLHDASFVRGDVNMDLAVDISDAVSTLNLLFLSGPVPYCMDAADANDDGVVDISDAVATLGSLFLGRGPLPAPAGRLGFDPTPDALYCDLSVSSDS